MAWEPTGPASQTASSKESDPSTPLTLGQPRAVGGEDYTLSHCNPPGIFQNIHMVLGLENYTEIAILIVSCQFYVLFHIFSASKGTSHLMAYAAHSNCTLNMGVQSCHCPAPPWSLQVGPTSIEGRWLYFLSTRVGMSGEISAFLCSRWGCSKL